MKEFQVLSFLKLNRLVEHQNLCHLMLLEMLTRFHVLDKAAAEKSLNFPVFKKGECWKLVMGLFLDNLCKSNLRKFVLKGWYSPKIQAKRNPGRDQAQ